MKKTSNVSTWAIVVGGLIALSFWSPRASAGELQNLLDKSKAFAALAVMLASDASQWITGAIIPLDGGNMAMNAGGTPGHEQHVVQTFRPETRSTTITGT